jgi:menaquinone-dependent protoporphyrinogen IX oxidase
MRILVTYGSKLAGTKGIATEIAAQLPRSPAESTGAKGETVEKPAAAGL